jgi:hypothetical protein
MAESGRTCVKCGHPVAIFSGITINGAAFHNHCWDRVEPVPEALPATRPDQARSRGGGHSDQPYARPREMPVVAQLQLGRTRF